MSEKNAQDNTVKTEGSEQQIFDFTKTAASSHNDEFQTYLHQREYQLRRSLEKRPYRSGGTYTWLLIFILMGSLVAISVYSVVQIQNQQQKIAALQQENKAQVAGVREDSEAKNIITGDGFSIVLNTQTPEGFVKNRLKTTSSYLTERESVLTSFSVKEKEILLGIDVEVTQYDNKLSREDFTKLVLTKITAKPNTKAQISPQSVSIPQNIVLTPITVEGSFIEYYTAVTADNYYVIRLYPATKENSLSTEVNTFVGTFLQNLYLN